MDYNQNDIDRFLSSCYIESSTGCWIWIKTINENGRAKFSLKRKMIYASRFSYWIYKGPFDLSLFVCHTCDNGLCVNPDHLWLGTQLDNMKDMSNKNRSLKGSKNPTAVLTETIVKNMINDIINLNINFNSLCLNYNIGETTVKNILYGRTWQHITKDFNLDDIRNKILRERKTGDELENFHIKVKALRDLGKSQKEIGHIMGKSQTYISKTLNKLGRA